MAWHEGFGKDTTGSSLYAVHANIIHYTSLLNLYKTQVAREPLAVIVTQASLNGHRCIQVYPIVACIDDDGDLSVSTPAGLSPDSRQGRGGGRARKRSREGERKVVRAVGDLTSKDGNPPRPSPSDRNDRAKRPRERRETRSRFAASGIPSVRKAASLSALARAAGRRSRLTTAAIDKQTADGEPRRRHVDIVPSSSSSSSSSSCVACGG